MCLQWETWLLKGIWRITPVHAVSGWIWTTKESFFSMFYTQGRTVHTRGLRDVRIGTYALSLDLGYLLSSHSKMTCTGIQETCSKKPHMPWFANNRISYRGILWLHAKGHDAVEIHRKTRLWWAVPEKRDARLASWKKFITKIHSPCDPSQ